ncbi:MAG: hypothetical protein LBP67_04305 [Bacteroidales bacterium]|jgi:hypothetical protein|nr:hypothetical protein [Bacteroidales bacterium]
MKRLKFLMPIGFLLIVAGFSAILMLLWNWLMPSIFGLITINFWQALGIFILARILFSSFGGGKMHMGKMMGHNHHFNPIHEKWAKMTPEQRKEFIEKRRKFGFGHPPREDFFEREFHKDNENGECNKDNG